MDNIVTKISGSTLTITIDLSKRLGASASGKTTIVASTRGGFKVNAPNGDVVNVGINAFTKGVKAAA
jgi:hypothetical protein